MGNAPDPCITDHIIGGRPSRLSTRSAYSNSTPYFNSHRNIESSATPCSRRDICNEGRLNLLLHGYDAYPTALFQVTRALRCMSEPPPETPIDTLVNQAAKDIVAAEKLRILETRVAQERRGVPERLRREARATT
jgi:hypothetical protein